MPYASPPAAGTAGERYRRAPTGVYRSNILGKPRMDFPSQPISSDNASEPSLLLPGSPVSPVLSPHQWKFLEQTRHQIVTTIIGQDTRGNVADDVTVEPDAFRFVLKLFSRTSRRRFNGRTTNESHSSRKKVFASITSRLFGN